jgi:hypothetical protein
MARTITNIPEELVLRVFNSLERLNDLYSVMLTCKQFNRISQDVTAETISRLALKSGSYFPALQPVSHFLLVASARRLSEWARAEEARQTRLKTTMHGGVTELAALALEVAPINLQDIRDVWTWKEDTVFPLSKRFDVTCGPASRAEGESHLTVCEDAELALFGWAIYGELFDHVLRLDWLESKAKLDSVTRFKFMIYCVPDVNSFNYMGLLAPQWFQDLRGRGESFQQLSLMHAFYEELNHAAFEGDIWQLMDLKVPRSTLDGVSSPPDPERSDKALLFVHIVMNSGRKSLEVMRLAHMARLGQQSDPEALVAWLWDTWALVEQKLGSNEGTVPRLMYTSDQYLERHVPSMQFDLQLTLWDNFQYVLRPDALTSDSNSATALHKAIAS